MTFGREEIHFAPGVTKAGPATSCGAVVWSAFTTPLAGYVTCQACKSILEAGG